MCKGVLLGGPLSVASLTKVELRSVWDEQGSPVWVGNGGISVEVSGGQLGGLGSSAGRGMGIVGLFWVTVVGRGPLGTLLFHLSMNQLVGLSMFRFCTKHNMKVACVSIHLYNNTFYAVCHSNICMHACTHTHTHTQIHKHSHAHTHMYTHTHTHTHTHTRSHL